MKKGIIKLIGNVASVVAIAILIYKMMRMEVDLSTLNEKKAIIFLIIASFIWTITNIIGCFPWLQCIYIFCGKKIDFKKVQIVYLKSNILKYIPGNVFQYVGRNKLAIDENCNHIDVALATLFEQVASAVMLLLYSLLFVNEEAFEYLKQMHVEYFPYILIGFIFFIILFLFCFREKIRTKIVVLLKKIFIKNNAKRLFFIMIYYLIIDLVGPIIYYLMLRILFNEMIQLSSVCYLIGVYLFSVLIGLITPGAPGGIGVREVVMITFTKGLLKESTIIIIAVLFRVISIAADFLSFIYAIIVDRMEK